MFDSRAFGQFDGPADERALETSATIFIVHSHGVECEHLGRIEVKVRGKAALAVTVVDDDAESRHPAFGGEYSQHIVKLHGLNQFLSAERVEEILVLHAVNHFSLEILNRAEAVESEPFHR